MVGKTIKSKIRIKKIILLLVNVLHVKNLFWYTIYIVIYNKKNYTFFFVISIDNVFEKMPG